MKPFILVYCYYNEGHNVSYGNFLSCWLNNNKENIWFLSCKHIYWLIRCYHWRSVIFTVGLFSSCVIVIMGPLLYYPTMEEMHNFYYANTFINFPNIYRWTFLVFTAGLLFKHLLWWAILCVRLSLQEVFLGPYYNLYWMQPKLWDF